jgi:Mrp family chromosome partitioning ATPase
VSSGIFHLRGIPFVNGHRNAYLAQFNQTASLFSSPGEESSLHSALISSAWPGEGSTTVTFGVARALRDSYGARVLAVEIGFASPAFGKLFNVPPEKSFAAVATGKIAPAEAFWEVESGFSVLAAGADPVAARSSVGRVLRQTMAAAQNSFDALLVDAPPLMHGTDTIAAGRIVPRLVLVVEAARTSSDTLQRVKKRLDHESISVIGCVLNKEKRYMPEWLYRRLSR